MTPKGTGLGRWPPSERERAQRRERLQQIRQARKQRERVEIDGRRYWLLRLPDGYAADYPLHDDEEAHDPA